MKIVYIADLDQDIDDYITVRFLHDNNLLDYIVLDPEPNNEGNRWISELKKVGVKINKNILPESKVVFCGGALSKVCSHICAGYSLDLLVMNGGFAGSNVTKYVNTLDKFRGKKFVRTFNFNIDVASTHRVLTSYENEIKEIVLVGKNVCHSFINTKEFLWKDYLSRKLQEHLKLEKKLHDLLAVHEGLAYLMPKSNEPFCIYENLYPITENGLDGNMTKWGSQRTPSIYRNCKIAVGFSINVNKQFNDL